VSLLCPEYGCWYAIKQFIINEASPGNSIPTVDLKTELKFILPDVFICMHYILYKYLSYHSETFCCVKETVPDKILITGEIIAVSKFKYNYR
jgi:hypothetical protein